MNISRDNMLFSFLFSLLVIIFGVYIFNTRMGFDLQEKQYAELKERLSDKLFQQIEANEYILDKSSPFIGICDRLFAADSVSRNYCLVLYIDHRHCVSCWKDEVKRFENMCDTLSFDISPIIIANNFSVRDLKMLEDGVNIPVYSIGNQLDFIPTLTKFNLPFYFMLSKDMHLCFPYYPYNMDSDNINSRYFKFAQQLSAVTDISLPIDSGQLVIQNPLINLGRISLRSKKSSSFRIINNSNDICHIYSCSPTCSCVLIDSFSNVIRPHSAGYVAFSVLKNINGPFNHSIMIQTNHNNQPLRLNLSGECQ